MKTLLAIVPLLALIAGLALYQHKGKRKILRFDSVQFFYAFVLMPVAYVWFKGFLFFLLQSYIGLSETAIFFWDAVYSVFFLFLYAFTVVHSLTKSFEIEKKKDPLYDLFEHSEYYHYWVSHTVVFVGAMLLCTLLAGLNAWIDLPWVISVRQFWVLLVAALGTAWLVFKAFLIADFGDFRFVKLMKLLVAVFFVLHIIIYSVFEPTFAGVKAMYWYQFVLFFGLSVISFIYPSELKGTRFTQRIRKRLAQIRRLLGFKK